MICSRSASGSWPQPGSCERIASVGFAVALAGLVGFVACVGLVIGFGLLWIALSPWLLRHVGRPGCGRVLGWDGRRRPLLCTTSAPAPGAVDRSTISCWMSCVSGPASLSTRRPSAAHFLGDGQQRIVVLRHGRPAQFLRQSLAAASAAGSICMTRSASRPCPAPTAENSSRCGGGERLASPIASSNRRVRILTSCWRSFNSFNSSIVRTPPGRPGCPGRRRHRRRSRPGCRVCPA